MFYLLIEANTLMHISSNTEFTLHKLGFCCNNINPNIVETKNLVRIISNIAPANFYKNILKKKNIVTCLLQKSVSIVNKGCCGPKEQ